MCNKNAASAAVTPSDAAFAVVPAPCAKPDPKDAEEFLEMLSSGIPMDSLQAALDPSRLGLAYGEWFKLIFPDLVHDQVERGSDFGK